MRYVALLRGINVGGKNKVDMKQLKTVFEDAGMTSVRTYINSGNVIFDTSTRGRARIAEELEKAIARRFGFKVDVLVRDLKTMRALVTTIPRGWKDDSTTRCYVMFLWDEIARPSVLKQVTFKPEMDDTFAGGIREPPARRRTDCGDQMSKRYDSPACSRGGVIACGLRARPTALVSDSRNARVASGPPADFSRPSELGVRLPTAGEAEGRS